MREEIDSPYSKAILTINQKADPPSMLIKHISHGHLNVERNQDMKQFGIYVEHNASFIPKTNVSLRR